jgi:hypothetical protein
MQFISYYDQLKYGQNLILRSADGTKEVTYFLADEQVVINPSDFQSFKNTVMDLLCELWFRKYGIRITYNCGEATVPEFRIDNTIEGEIVETRKAIEGA